MHVLIIPSWYPSNENDINGSFFREQAIALQKNGCKVGVIYPALRSLRAWRSIWSGQRKIAKGKDEGVITYRSHGMNWLPRSPLFFSKLFEWHGRRLYDRYISENGLPDIVHVHSLLYASSVAVALYKKHKIPFVVTEHSSAFGRSVISKKEMMLAKKNAHYASQRFAVSESLAILLDRLMEKQRGTWKELPNIVEQRFLDFPMSERIGNDSFEFISIANLNKNKGHANMIRAFSMAAKRNPDISLTIGGDGPERNNLRKLARDLNVLEKIKFSGLLTRQQVLTLMAKSDALVVASRYETFGVVVIEALALGKPVIATRCGGPETIVRTQDGVLVPVDNVEEMAHAMSKMALARGSYDAFEIRRSCAFRFSEAAVVDRLKEIYKNNIS